MDKDAKCELVNKNHYDIKMVTVIRKDLKMRRGKENSQGQHAALGIFTRRIIDKKRIYINSIDENDYKEVDVTFRLTKEMVEWLEESFAKVCLQCDSEVELLKLYSLAKLADLPCILITDNGTTEFHGVPTNTCITIGPANSEEIDKITGHLKLL
jgi:PTH2 family peptidyl-tRNA hydrolase